MNDREELKSVERALVLAVSVLGSEGHGWEADVLDGFRLSLSTIPDGYVLVPLEPTKAMCGAIFDDFEGGESPAVQLTKDASNEVVSRVYRAMIAASPTNQEKANGND